MREQVGQRDALCVKKIQQHSYLVDRLVYCRHEGGRRARHEVDDLGRGGQVCRLSRRLITGTVVIVRVVSAHAAAGLLHDDGDTVLQGV